MTKPDDIRRRFEQHKEALSEQKKTIEQKIIKWRDARVREIDDCVAKENKRLDKEYKKQKQLLEQKCEQYMNEAQSRDKKKDKEHLTTLLNQCAELQFELSELEHYIAQIDFIRIKTQDQLIQEIQNESNMRENEGKQSQTKRSKKDDNNNTTNNGNASERSSPDPTSAGVKSSSRRPSMTQTSSELDHSKNDDDNSKSNANNVADTTDKCPVCFMIFPPSMAKHHREQHVNEHYEDD